MIKLSSHLQCSPAWSLGKMPGLGNETADLASKELRERGRLNPRLQSPNCCGCGSLRSLCSVAKAQLCAVKASKAVARIPKAAPKRLPRAEPCC